MFPRDNVSQLIWYMQSKRHVPVQDTRILKTSITHWDLSEWTPGFGNENSFLFIDDGWNPWHFLPSLPSSVSSSSTGNPGWDPEMWFLGTWLYLLLGHFLLQVSPRHWEPWVETFFDAFLSAHLFSVLTTLAGCVHWHELPLRPETSRWVEIS